MIVWRHRNVSKHQNKDRGVPIQEIIRVFEIWSSVLEPSTLYPADVWLSICGSLVKVDGLREAFPEAGILDSHVDYKVVLRTRSQSGILETVWLLTGFKPQEAAPGCSSFFESKNA